MSQQQTAAPGFDALKPLLLKMAEERSVDGLLDTIVSHLADLPHVALARLWLIRPGDICASCHVREECPDQTNCLHLVASAGGSQLDSRQPWSRIDGRFRRFPMGVRKVGRIASSGEAINVADIEQDPQWIAEPEWARAEGIRAFVGKPLLFKGEALGVLAVFLRAPLVDPESTVWLRMMADHAAAAIANARSFDEIARLKRRLELENEYLREEVSEAQAFGDIVGRSPALKNVLQQVELVAATDASVLILGESGTGKELIVREIHRRSNRCDGPMIKVNCASIPRELYESEFFGHVKGAFTGALRDRAGRFEAADGGTLFLDEVGEIPLDLQSKLLRALQEGQYERVGDERTRSVDIRIIAATNRDLKKEVEAGNFRNDLYFRLSVFPIEVTPLRRRPEDLAPLAAHFLDLAAKRMNRPAPRLTQAHILDLQAYDWPGNVRELQNVIERAVITSRSRTLHFELPESTPSTPIAQPDSSDADIIPEREMRRRERDNIKRALQACSWKIYGVGGAAELLGIKPTTLASRIKKLKLKRPAG